MNYLSLSNDDLHQKTIQASINEKNATLVLLEFLYEVERRRLFAARGFSSLWLYVHRDLGYSEAQTTERVSAMKLMNRIPEVRESIQNKELSLTTAAKLASFVRREKVSQEKTVELLHRVANQSKREVDKILFLEQKNPESRSDMVQRRGFELSRISFDADEEFMELLNELKEIQSHLGASLQEILKKPIREFIEKRKRNFCIQRSSLKKESQWRDMSKNTRYIPMNIKRATRMRSQDQCEFVADVIDPITKTVHKRRCGSKSQLQFDHQIPFALGGGREESNIRHLCKQHNLFESEKVFGKFSKTKKAG